MGQTFFDIGLVFVFIIMGGLFAAAEMALVSIREGQVAQLAETGRRGAAVARLAAEPNRFLSAVQVGVTLAGFLSAAFGGATLADRLAPTLENAGLGPGLAAFVALVLITIAISYFSIVLSELTAKRLALQRTVPIALAFAPTVDRIARISKPLIWLLSISTNTAVRLLGGDPTASREQMSEDELRGLVKTHGGFSAEERQIVEDVFNAGDRQLREVMLPRTEVDFMDASTPVYKAVAFAVDQPHSRYPVIRGSADDVVGFVHVRDLFDPHMQGRSVRVGELARTAIFFPSTRNVLSALTDMRRANVHLAIVIDEYGGTDGIVTLEDLVEELVGDIRDEYDAANSDTTRLLSGELEVDGLLNLADFQDETGIALPEGPYETVAGFMAAQLGHLPALGSTSTVESYLFTVIEMDGRRVARIRVTAQPRAEQPAPDAEADEHPAAAVAAQPERTDAG